MIRRLSIAGLLLLLCAVSARAQFITVTATVKDPNGIVYQNCSGSADFVPAATATTNPLISGSVFQTSFPISSCDSFGNFTLVGLADNNQVVDGHTGAASQWRFSICSVSSPRVCFNTAITITAPSPQNISAQLQAAAALFPTTPFTSGSIPSLTVTSGLSIPSSGAATIASVNGMLNAASFAGADIDAQVNSAFTACSNACTAYIPAGTYNSVTTTISFPVNSNGTTALWCDPGAVINYTGSSDWLQAFGTGASGGQNTANVYIYGGCRVNGTSSGTAGIHTRIFQRGVIRDITISGFTNGDGIFNEGSNTIEIYSPRLNGNKNGVHNVGIHQTNNFSANAIKVYGGVIQNNSQWGWFEDGATAATTGPNQKNVISTTFETNGQNGSGTSGNIFIQQCDSCEVNGSYLEYANGAAPVNNVVVGDATFSPSNTLITGNIFLTGNAATNSILIQGSTTAMKIENNIEDGTNTNFINRATGVRLLNIGYNRAAAVGNYVVGTDGGFDTYIEGSSGPSNTYTNGSAATTRGYGFNLLSGLSTDLAVRTRSGGTNSMVWQAGGSGATVATMSDTGQIIANGGVTAGSVGTGALQAGTVQNGVNSVINVPTAGASLTATIGSGTTTTNGTAINTLTSQAQPAITITGADPTKDVATCSLNAAMPASWQTGIVMLPPVVTTNTVTVWLSNPTATASITPAAAVVRCTVTR